LLAEIQRSKVIDSFAGIDASGSEAYWGTTTTLMSKRWLGQKQFREKRGKESDMI
jgi:hypothetical protein